MPSSTTVSRHRSLVCAWTLRTACCINGTSEVDVEKRTDGESLANRGSERSEVECVRPQRLVRKMLASQFREDLKAASQRPARRAQSG